MLQITTFHFALMNKERRRKDRGIWEQKAG